MDFLRALRVGFQIARDAIVESHAEGEQQVGLLNRRVDPRLAVHAHHAEAQRVRRREAADSEQRLRRRDIGFLRERPDDVHGAGQDDAVAREDQRPFGAVDQLERALKLLRARAPVGAELRFLRRGRIPVELARRLLRVLRDVDVDGAGPSRSGNLEGLAEGRRDVVRARHQVVVLRDRQGHAGDVGFLKRVRADQLAAHLAGDADDRRAVHHRRRDAGHHVRRAGPGCRNRDADLPARAGIAVGHVRRALLVPDQHMADRIIEHGVIGRKDGAAGITEDVGHSLANETFPNNLRSCAFHMHS